MTNYENNRRLATFGLRGTRGIPLASARVRLAAAGFHQTIREGFYEIWRNEAGDGIKLEIQYGVNASTIDGAPSATWMIIL